jgi:hypothetical protein
MRATVSLHSHSACSKEILDFVPSLARRIPLVARLFEATMAKYEREHGRPLDFNTMYWRPPLPPAAVIESERRQIERRFGGPALVSLTDHDTLAGPRTLRAAGMAEVPLSVEWSIPFSGTVLHLGIHSISPVAIDEAERELAAYTAGEGGDLGELLDWLCECPETFVVLNHPYWDLSGVGSLQHEAILLTFLRHHRHRIHALELNGYRAWAENRRVLPLAETFGLPVVGGGDRHGYTPNTILNLTPGSTLSQFACELREGRPTYCVVLPEYDEPYEARVLETAGHLLRRWSPHEGRQDRWRERVFMTVDGQERSAGSEWPTLPVWLDVVMFLMRVMGSDVLRPLLSLVRSDGQNMLRADCDGSTIAKSRQDVDIPRSAGPATIGAGSM